jgi:branched-chain amino acid transport system substrate-binding protein
MWGKGVLAAALACAVLPIADAHGQGRALTVYSSLPLSGAASPQTQAVVRGAQLALAEAGGMAGAHPIRYVSLNDATRAAGTWAPERVARNARRAALDDSAIAYIGDFNSGASAISIPILNEAGVPQISPSNTATGLTRRGPGAEPGEPDKYYPAGRRTYFRIAPNDTVQGRALAAAMRDRGCRRIASLDDGEIYGRGVGTWMRRAARRLGLRTVLARTARRSGHARIARRVRRARADCVAYTGITANGAVGMFRALGRVVPRAQLFGSDGIAESGFTGRVPPQVAQRVLIIVSTLPPGAYPPAGQDFFRRFSAHYGVPNPDPYAIAGYEAMRLVLDAVASAGPRQRAVIGWLRAMPEQARAIGTYGFDRFGDATLRTFGLYRINGGALEFAGTAVAP